MAEQNFDAWGRKRNVTTWDYANVGSVPDWLYRGYTGHEHLPEFGLINMNARLYDPVLGRMLSVDNFVGIGGTQAFNRYSYANNNPLKFVDPDGNSVIGAVIIGAVIGAYSGGAMANNGNYNPLKWDYNSSKTWGYMLGGAFVGGASGGAGAYVAASKVAFANTLGIVSGSLINSVGMNIVTNGQTPISVNFGFGSYNFTTDEFGYLGKKGNSSAENLGYAMGALTNISDILAGCKTKGSVDLVTEHSDAIGHSAIVNENYVGDKSIVSFGPTRPASNPSKSLLAPWGLEGDPTWATHTNDGSPLWRTNIKSVNVSRITAYGNRLKNSGTGYNLYTSSCVSHTSRALNSAGIFNIGIHPYVLALQMSLREFGFRPFLSSYYLLGK